MAEQYIYSRSGRGFTNARGQTVPLGFGFVAWSPGMDKPRQKDAAVHCEDCPCPDRRDGAGQILPVLRKSRLSKGRVLLQKSTWIQDGDRDFHVAHGYVLEAGEAESAGPAGWLSAPFRLDDPNQASEGILLDSVTELPGGDPTGFGSLGDTASAWELDRETFCQLLLACFDALASRRLVLLAHDFGQPGEEERRRALFYWLYACLPRDLRLGLGFDSVYTEKTTPKLVQLAFLDREVLRREGSRFAIQQGSRTVPLGGNFLLLDGRLLHGGSHKTEWYGQEGAYAAWLRRIVDAAWELPGGAAVSELDRARGSLQLKLDTVPEENRLAPEVYSAACGSCSAGDAKTLPDPEESAAGDTAQAAGLTGQQKIVMEILLREEQTAPDGDVRRLSAMMGTEMQPYALGLLGAFAAREAAGGVTAALRRYRALLPEWVYAVLPYRLFWGGLDRDEQEIWDMCGVRSGTDAAKALRLRWYVETVSAFAPGDSRSAYVRRMLDALPGIGGEFRAYMEQELQSVFTVLTAKS